MMSNKVPGYFAGRDPGDFDLSSYESTKGRRLYISNHLNQELYMR